jgi:hypothetical protein
MTWDIVSDELFYLLSGEGRELGCSILIDAPIIYASRNPDLIMSQDVV